MEHLQRIYLPHRILNLCDRFFHLINYIEKSWVDRSHKKQVLNKLQTAFYVHFWQIGPTLPEAHLPSFSVGLSEVETSVRGTKENILLHPILQWLHQLNFIESDYMRKQLGCQTHIQIVDGGYLDKTKGLCYQDELVVHLHNHLNLLECTFFLKLAEILLRVFGNLLVWAPNNNSFIQHDGCHIMLFWI